MNLPCVFADDPVFRSGAGKGNLASQADNSSHPDLDRFDNNTT